MRGEGFSASEFRRGVGLGFPIFLGYLPIGMAFGILARTVGFSVASAGLCSGLVLSGSGQLIALSFLGSGAGIGATLLATSVINLRYVLFSSTLSRVVKGFSLPRMLTLAAFITDESFAVNMADAAARRLTADSMLGVGVISWSGWLLGTLIGASIGHLVGDPAAWGLDFAMTAMFAALFVAVAENRRHVAVGFGAALLVVAMPYLGTLVPGFTRSWHVIAASLIAATAATVVFRDE